MKKSSTNKKDTGNLEDVFRQAFEGASEPPPSDLWTRLDHQLQAQEAVGLRRRVVWYRRVAAAALVLLLCLGSYTYFAYQAGGPSRPELAQINPTQAPGSELNKGPETGQSLPGPETTGQSPATRGADRPQQEQALAGGPTAVPGSPSARVGRQAQLNSDPQPAIARLNPPVKNQRRSGSVAAEVSSATAREGARPTGSGEERSTFVPEVGEPSLALRAGNQTLPSAQETLPDPAVEILPRPETPVAAQQALQSLVVLPRPQPVDSLDQQHPDRARSGEDLLPESLKRSRWSVGGSYGAHYFAQNIALRNDFSGSARTFSNASPAFSMAAPANTYEQAVDEFIQNTRAGQSFGATLRGGYQLDRHWRLEGGFTFSQNESQTKTSYLVTGMQILQSSLGRQGKSVDMLADYQSIANTPVTTIMLPALAGLDSRDVSVNKSAEFTTSYRYRFVGLPLQMVFQSRQTRSFVFASAGVSPQLLVESTLQTDSPLTSTVELSAGKGSPFRRLNAAGSASFGYGYRMSDGLSLTLGPEVQSFLVPLVKSTGQAGIRQGRPLNLGLHLTARYQLK